MANRCFMQGCELEAQYVCFCLGSQTYSCQFHLQIHLKLPNITHNFDSVLLELSKRTKYAILEFLAKEKSKKEELKNIALTINWQCCQIHRDSIDENLKRLDSDLNKISSLIKKYSEKEKSSLLNPFILEQDEDSKRDKEIFATDSELYRSVISFCELSQLRNKISEILNRATNERETEQDFRKTCSLYEKHAPNSLFSQAYEEYINAYQKITSTYLFNKVNEKLNLFIYDTENEREEVKVLEIPVEEEAYNFIVQLPNSESFLVNSSKNPEFYIVDRNYRTQKLPSVWFKYFYTCVYFNRSVYCFGMCKSDKNCICAVRFDLTKYRWIILAKMKTQHIWNFDSVVFNGSILISNSFSYNLLLYSIDIDSFSEIPYKFPKNKRKIMINGEERLYLIECERGWIYESEIRNEYVLNKIAKSIIPFNPEQVYISYNKGGFYISALDYWNNLRAYYKFDLGQYSLTEIACYCEVLALKKLDNKSEAIDCYGQDFKFNSDHVSTYIQKRAPVSYVVRNLKEIERYSQNDADASECYSKAGALQSLGRNLEALECYNKLIKLAPQNVLLSLIKKVEILYDLGRYLETLDCYDELITYMPSDKNYYLKKADSLYDLERYHEAIECYNEFIKFKPENEYSYIRKADNLHRMGKNHKAVKYFNKAIELKSDNPLYFCYHANMLNDLGEVAKAIKEFNKAYDLFILRIYNDDIYWGSLIEIEDYLELLKMLCKLLEGTIEFKEKVEKIKCLNIENTEIFYEIEEKEKVIKEKHAQIIKKTVKCIDIKRTKSIEVVEKMKIEVAEYQKEIIDAVTQLPICARLIGYKN